jgi:signal peptidase II
MSTGWRRALMVVAAVVVVDQVTKAAVVANVALGDNDAVFPGFDLTYVRNSGVAFGALAGGGTIVWVLTLAALGGLLAYFALHADHPMLWLPVGIIAGGAIGNLADRARVGYVIDFIDPVLWPAFNVADICIVVGILAFVYVAEGDKSSTPSP